MQPPKELSAPGVTRAYPLVLFPLVIVLAALWFPLPARSVCVTREATPERSSSFFLHCCSLCAPTWSDRVLSRLEQAESKEIDPWLRDDIRIAWITVLNASRGNRQAHVDATYRVLGVHPDKVFPQIVARRRSKLGDQYSLWFEEVSPAALTPRKPAQSERRLPAARRPAV